MRRSSCPSVLAVLLLLATPALAQVRVDGSYRLRAAFDTNLSLDDAGTRLGQTGWAEHRLRLTPRILYGGDQGTAAEVVSEFDVLSGLIAGDLAPSFQGLGWTERSERNGTRATGFDFRHLFLQTRFPAGVLMLGQMPNQWGMGLLMNSGADELTTDFGDHRFGDIVERALFAFRPLSFLGARNQLAQRTSLSLAADIVYRDRLASLVVRNGGGLQWGDTAYQLVGALRFDPDERTRAGLYVARRIQDYLGDGGNLHAWIFDAHARTLISGLPYGATLQLEAEGAVIDGGTTHVTAPGSGSAQVTQLGGAARATLAAGELETELEAGYASGDHNPLDGDATGFNTSRDYKVGLVLWDEVMLFQTQRSAQRLADPRLSGRPPRGVDLIPTQGAITNAVWLKPTVRFRPGFLRGKVRFVGSVLWARAPEPVTDAYQTLLASAPRNAFGGAAGQGYGLELDASVIFHHQLGEGVGVELGAQGGLLLPGDVFDGPTGKRMANASAAKLRAGFFF